MSTRIDYLDEAWNPITGCTPISDGCKHCYARQMAARLKGMGAAKYQHVDPFAPRFHPQELDKLKHWRKPKVIGMAFMSDMFHPAFDVKDVETILDAMTHASQHTYVLLTKRSDYMADFLKDWPWADWWLGVTAENQACFDERIKPLAMLAEAGWNTWVSFEPLLEGIDRLTVATALYEEVFRWAIVGCESGPGRRPMKEAWAAEIVDECLAQATDVYVKQMEINGRVSHNPREWPAWARVRELPWKEKA